MFQSQITKSSNPFKVLIHRKIHRFLSSNVSTSNSQQMTRSSETHCLNGQKRQRIEDNAEVNNVPNPHTLISTDKYSIKCSSEMHSLFEWRLFTRRGCAISVVFSAVNTTPSSEGCSRSTRLSAVRKLEEGRLWELRLHEHLGGSSGWTNWRCEGRCLCRAPPSPPKSLALAEVAEESTNTTSHNNASAIGTYRVKSMLTIRSH